MEGIWNAILDFMARLLTPDWGSLIALIPIAILALVVLFVAWLLWRLTRLGPSRRGKGRVRPAPPSGIHMPGPSWAPVFGSIGVALVLFGLVFGPVLVLLGVTALVLALLYWGAEAMRDYDHVAGERRQLPAVVHEGPPPGVHMPGPSFRPVLAAIAMAVLLFGLVFGGWLIAVGIAMLVITLIGWLRDARAEYVQVERADRTGHLESLPPPRVPSAVFALFGALFVVAIILNSGLIPGGAASGSTGGSAAPGGSAGPGGGSGNPGGSGGPPPASLPPADLTVSAEGIKYDQATLTAPAAKPFTIGFDNKDPQIPHNIDLADGSGKLLFEGQTVTGPGQILYQVPALAGGTYKFSCKWHPNMVGELTAK